ncbi:hypothetical protein ACFXO2_31075 [Streptomyces sp. NPDC059152]|uniref:hypothetical protein n=1 Tax=unclassified Streptomyces TaxID=2593676 RepID=UPI000C2755E0|nr:hypothetical protein [Streptomyces sp. CB02959]PJN34601.1 hypothetical protein CG747_39240 [Streptomyces sp. CB02959]
MDPEIAALAGTAGTTLVTLLTTETWQNVRDRVVSLWQRARPDRAPAIADEIETTRDELLGAQSAGDREIEAELGVEWQGRIRRLLTACPELSDELRVMLDELAAVDAVVPSVAQDATASGQARVYQAGRDMRIGGVEGV